jgi:glycerol-3-phosphate acyltransferase PlsY
MACAILAVIGHNWSIFLGFRGGRGLATLIGALLAFDPVN